MTAPTKYLLDEDAIPAAWYNIQADLPSPPPPVLHPGTLQPVGPDDLAPLFPDGAHRTGGVHRARDRDSGCRCARSTARGARLRSIAPVVSSRRWGLPARIYYKYEGVSPTGSHKPNTAVAQAFYNQQEGVSRLATETGAGQWGSSLAYAGALFGLEVKVYMVRVSFDQKPYRKAMMETYGATCIASPSEETNAGRGVLGEHPDSTGSLGIAISEAVEDAATREDTKYSLGSVLNHVLMHQSVIGQEALAQFELADDYPDVVVGCTGGGSNFSGIAFPFIGAKLRGGRDVRVVAVEPAACPSLTRGKYAYDFGDTANMTPLVKMHTLGSAFVPSGFHAGGLRYHGMAPLVSHCVELELVEPTAYTQAECFEAGVEFSRAESIIPAPEANHAVKGAMVEALRCKEEGTSRAILFNLCGHGHFDMQAYTDYFAGNLAVDRYDESEVAMALAGLPSVA